MKSYHYFVILFVIVCIGELIAQAVELTTLHHICKPLIMISLGLYYFTAAQYRTTLVVLAIVLSFLGDSFLMYDHLNPLYFMLGLGSFLVAHVFYALAYKQHALPGGEVSTDKVHRFRLAFPIVLAGSGLIVILYPHLGELRIPVVVYAGVLMVMVLLALQRMGHTSNESFWKVFAGAVLFMISDGMLAINKFIEPIAFAGVLIMITYMAAQYLIIKGLVAHTRLS